MSCQVSGCRPVKEWLSQLDDRQSALCRKLNEIYAGDEELSREAARVCRTALQAFGDCWSPDRSAMLVRSTGRINLLGMHVDHRGGSVNPIAIKEVFFVVEPRDDDLVTVRNTQADEFAEESFRIRECLPAHKIGDWDAWCHDEFEKRKGDPSVTWSNYVRSAVLYLQHLSTKPDGTPDPAFRGMNVMVCGNIPRAAGLSTSSSIVVATAEACARINGLEITPMDLVESCGYGEWYVGTRGGSGDHAAIRFGEPSAIVHMTSFPLTVQPVPFPADYRVVLANSFVEANKRAGARDAFNNRVASYVFGFMIARKSFPEYAAKLEHLRDINPDRLGVDEAEIYRILKAMPGCATREDVLQRLPDQEDEVRHVFRSHAEPPEGYRIRQACMYGVAECLRSDMAVQRLNAGDVKGFGELINLSHDGDRVTRLVNGERVPTDNSYPDDKIDALVSDLRSGDPERVERARLWRQPGGYDVSVPEMDELVDIALATPGVAGAGLVGAGLGGSIVAVAEAEHAQELVDNLTRQYYEPRNLPAHAEIVAPVGGAGVLDV